MASSLRTTAVLLPPRDKHRSSRFRTMPHDNARIRVAFSISCVKSSIGSPHDSARCIFWFGDLPFVRPRENARFFRSNRDHEARVARSAALEPRVMLIPPSATRPERAKLSQVLDGTVNTVERRRIPRIRPWTPPLSPRFSYMTSASASGRSVRAHVATPVGVAELPLA